MTQPVRIAIIGSGNIAETHVQAIKGADRAELAGVCSRNRSRADQLAGTEQARSFTTLEELFTWGEFDAVTVATPSGTHGAISIAALEKGFHVICEKPLEISRDRAERITEVAAKSGCVLSAFFPLRQGRGARAIKHALDQGRFGRLAFVCARIKWWRDPSYYSNSSWRGTKELDGGGALMNQGIHAVDLIQWYAGIPAWVSGFCSTMAHPKIEVEDTLIAACKFECGAVGSIEASTACYPGLEMSVELCGTEGTAILVNDSITDWRFRESLEEDDGIGKVKDSVIHGGTSDPKAISAEGHRQQLQDFCRVIQGENIPYIDGNEAAKAVSIVEAIYRSCSTGRQEKVIL